MNEVYKFLDANKIAYEHFDHKAVFTVAEAQVHTSHIEGQDCKNLFLKSKEKAVTYYFLVILPADEVLSLSSMSMQLGAKKLSFASADELLRILGVTPGSVSLFNLLNDQDKIVQPVVSKVVVQASKALFHPNDNSKTVVIAG